MSDHHARSARDDVYDHEHEEPRSGRRRRPVADWGVGDDAFETMPRNRFSTTAEAPPRERRFAREDDEPRLRAVEDEPEHEEPQPDVPRGRVDDGRRTLRIGKDEDMPSEIAAIAADRDINTEELAVPEKGQGVPERRTVKIGGHPEGSLEAARYQRDRARRPRRTASERVGHRPDRIAMWAFALGLLLIVIAILTAM
ncbi:MAG TPA: hypothetical protein VFR77_07865 [Steroidobacteraceae bacterium]|nr:hypothetical protein [Steroidobacteraceae bacterium]